MANKKAEVVIKRLEEQNKRFTIEVLGNEENKDYAFAILVNHEHEFGCGVDDTFHGIRKDTIALLKEAEIKFKILK